MKRPRHKIPRLLPTHMPPWKRARKERRLPPGGRGKKTYAISSSPSENRLHTKPGCSRNSFLYRASAK
ncbi:hypothetical protein M5E88_04905 [Akkermansia muciniphila]|nr:hypothetical protein M5E88_04905 [Akkermansia muciniphila]